MQKIIRPFLFQKKQFMKNLEELLFDVSDDIVVHNMKQDLMFQIGKFDINIDVKGLFTIDGKLVAAVSAIVIQFQENR